jgi:hypothetical protein
MINEKFSAESFGELGLDSIESRELANSLEYEVNKELQLLIETKFEEIVTKLNLMGHQLKLEEKTTGEISYRDDNNDDDGYHCKLRLAFDYLTSAGYADLHPADDLEESKIT